MNYNKTKEFAALALLVASAATAPAAVLKSSDFDLGGAATNSTLNSGTFAFDNDYTYAESPSNGSNARVQDAPYNNGGTLFLAAGRNNPVSDSQMTLSLAAATFGGPFFNTSTLLDLQLDAGSNFVRVDSAVTNGLYFGGTTASVLVTWSPGGSTYNAGVWSGIGAAVPSDLVDGATLAGSVAFSGVGTALDTIVFNIIENGTNYDVTFNVGGEDNTFSVPISSLGDIDTMGLFALATDGGNSNFDNLTLTGEVVPELSSVLMAALGALSLLRRSRK